MIYAYTVYGVGITPAVLAAFFWKRATTAGGVSSIAAGLIVTLVWEFGKVGAMLSPHVPDTYRSLVGDAGYPALAACVFCLVVGSLLTKAPDPTQWQPFFKKETA